MSLDIPSPETYSTLRLYYLEAELGSLSSKELELLLAISLLIVLSPFVDVSLTVLEHSIDETSEPVGHGGDGFGGTQLGAQTAVLSP